VAPLPKQAGSPVDGRGDGKGVARVAPEGAALGVGEARLATQGAQEGVVELLGLVGVAGSQHDVAEHGVWVSLVKCLVGTWKTGARHMRRGHR